jgi:hypothetical protein
MKSLFVEFTFRESLPNVSSKYPDVTGQYTVRLFIDNVPDEILPEKIPAALLLKNQLRDIIKNHFEYVRESLNDAHTLYVAREQKNENDRPAGVC